MEMDIDPYWIVGGGVGIAVLGAIAWFYTQRDPGPEEEEDAAPARPAEAPAEAAEEDPGEPVTAPPTEPDLEATEDRPVDADGDGEDGMPREDRPGSAVDAEPANEATAADVEADGAAERAVEHEDPADLTEAERETPPKRDEAFEAARAALARALQAGHFSKPDVLHAWEHRDWRAGERKPPRSEYFHRIVNEAVRTRNAFEAMLCDEDRKTFVDQHSQYLDDVAALDDPEAREQAHETQVRLLAELRPRTAGATEPDSA